MAKVTITIDQKKLNNLIKDMRRYTKEVGDRVDNEMTATAFDIDAGAKKLVPVDEGILKNSIQVLENKRFSKKIGTELEYAPFVEFGTSKMRAQPYLFPSFEKNRPLLIKRIKRILKDTK